MPRRRRTAVVRTRISMARGRIILEDTFGDDTRLNGDTTFRPEKRTYARNARPRALRKRPKIVEEEDVDMGPDPQEMERLMGVERDANYELNIETVAPETYIINGKVKVAKSEGSNDDVLRSDVTVGECDEQSTVIFDYTGDIYADNSRSFSIGTSSPCVPSSLEKSIVQESIDNSKRSEKPTSFVPKDSLQSTVTVVECGEQPANECSTRLRSMGTARFCVPHLLELSREVVEESFVRNKENEKSSDLAAKDKVQSTGCHEQSAVLCGGTEGLNAGSIKSSFMGTSISSVPSLLVQSAELIQEPVGSSKRNDKSSSFVPKDRAQSTVTNVTGEDCGAHSIEQSAGIRASSEDPKADSGQLSFVGTSSPSVPSLIEKSEEAVKQSVASSKRNEKSASFVPKENVQSTVGECEKLSTTILDYTQDFNENSSQSSSMLTSTPSVPYNPPLLQKSTIVQESVNTRKSNEDTLSMVGEFGEQSTVKSDHNGDINADSSQSLSIGTPSSRSSSVSSRPCVSLLEKSTVVQEYVVSIKSDDKPTDCAEVPEAQNLENTSLFGDSTIYSIQPDLTSFTSGKQSVLSIRSEGECYLEGYNGDMDDHVAQLMHICGQDDFIYFEDYIKRFRNLSKLGEGTFGEVFRADFDGSLVALKVVPFVKDMNDIIEVNGDYTKPAQNILPELLISKSLSDLGDHYINQTPGFVKVHDAKVVKGDWPENLLQCWKVFQKKHKAKAYNTYPAEYMDAQKIFYLLISLEYGGDDLECYVTEKKLLKTEKEVLSLLIQSCMTLSVAEAAIKFEHRDLHWGNVLVKSLDDKDTQISYLYNGTEIHLKSYGLKVSLIDFTNGRMSLNGATIYLDLSTDEDMFTGKGEGKKGGDYQFDIYRMMKDLNQNEWSTFTPKTNNFWVHYLSKKLINNIPRLARSRKKELQDLFDHILEADTIQDFIVLPEVHELFKDYIV
ncbi:unnamed protein product [Bursaphelenchus okinawaensis]|uniref:non-specific serine/threonine protein kinase n=1 Tax=Bursaphelenchus okinawaensis TaxID=465554 RepID=A0A811K6C0_9BILA|nr:unnamed protein product [Bursaphelenchus okinawaensis]CAG9093800.1 unnamed protein product [Bursaphelenchus okinawaensis]